MACTHLWLEVSDITLKWSGTTASAEVHLRGERARDPYERCPLARTFKAAEVPGLAKQVVEELARSRTVLARVAPVGPRLHCTELRFEPRS